MGTDSLYYIMDYSGHYYRTNQADQLVAAAGEQEATVFTLAQANRHIGVGKKASFYCMVPIEQQTESINLTEVERITGEPEHIEVTKMQPAADEQEENMYAAENIEDMVG